MRVLVDTSVWSLALRRAAPPRAPSVVALSTLVGEGRVAMLGLIRQELLSGLRGEAEFRRLRDRLRAYDDLTLVREDHEEAAACFNRCRAAVVQGGAVDFLICAVALRRRLPVLTTDRDFSGYARVLGLRLYAPAPGG